MEACNGQFQRGGTDNIIQPSEDNQMTIGSLTDPIPTTNIPLLNKLNTKVKEPSKLIFFHGAMFEETINIKDQRGYSQSQPLIMLVVPIVDTVSAWGSIKLPAAPRGVTHFGTFNGIPTEECWQLIGKM